MCGKNHQQNPHKEKTLPPEVHRPGNSNYEEFESSKYCPP
jgi:hypothetical protein